MAFIEDRRLAAMPVRHAVPRTMSEEEAIERMLDGVSTGGFRQLQASESGAELDEPLDYSEDSDVVLAAVLADLQRHP